MSDKAMQDKEIRERFAALCRRMGWAGPSAIARAMGWNQPDVSHWLSGRRSIPDHHLAALAHLAGETMDYFTRPWTEIEKRNALIAVEVMEREAERLRARATSPAAGLGADAGALDAELGKEAEARKRGGGGGASEDPQDRESA